MTRHIHTLLTTLLLLTALSGCATVRRELGYALISDATEAKLGAQFSAQIEAEEIIHSNRRLQAYIRTVAAPLVDRALQDRPGIQYRIKVLDDPKQINSFA
jgi:predicted Zn-dependent protease